jgi:hypothetical protein
VPALGVVPLAGLYVIVPAARLLVALSCVADSAVPYVIALGVAHVSVGVALATVTFAVVVVLV